MGHDQFIKAEESGAIPTVEELLKAVASYMPDADFALIEKAYHYIMEAHSGVARDSGEPYVSHPLAVAQILIEQGVDSPTLIAGLLHDVVEDTPSIHKEDIAKEFSEEIAELVDGVTKLTNMEVENSNYNKTDGNLSKLTIAISKDLRVLIVKLADRLHNMRTLHHRKKIESRKRTAEETLHVFANFADFAGLKSWKEELEELAFKELQPIGYKFVTDSLDNMRNDSETLIKIICDKLKQDLADKGIKGEVTGRIKTPYSIWKKLQKKSISLSAVSDILGFRAIVENTEDCYRSLGIFHQNYRSAGDSAFSDFISNPKKNGYSSLHTAVYFKPHIDWQHIVKFLEIYNKDHTDNPIIADKMLGIRIEVQIRSKSMDELAENGDASHLLYKAKDAFFPQKEENYSRRIKGRNTYLQQLLGDLLSLKLNDDFSKNLKSQTEKQILVFTPQGSPINLPRGSSALDFAFAIHHELGIRSSGAKLDGRLVPINTPLMESGHKLEILTVKTPQVEKIWESWVKSPKAIREIRHELAKIRRQKYIDQGKLSLERIFQEQGYEFNPKVMKEAILRFDIQTGNENDLLEKIGRWINQVETKDDTNSKSVKEKDVINPKDVLYAIYPKAKNVQMSHVADESKKASYEIKKIVKLKVSHPQAGKNATIYNFANCCCPLPGEWIIGFLVTDSQVSIHRTDCPSLSNLESLKDRWLDVGWADDADKGVYYQARLRMTMLNRAGTLHRVTGIIAKEESNISNLKFKERHLDIYTMDLELEVRNAQHLYQIESSLSLIEGVSQVKRR